MPRKSAGALGFSRAPAEGLWQDDGQTKHDDIIVMEVMAEGVDTEWWRAYRKSLETRFRQDVIALQPKVVVILGGANDFAGYAGPATEGTVSENIMTMAELAKLHGIKVVLASVTPICDCYQILSARRPPGRILGLNGWLKGYAARAGAVYADVYAVLAEGRTMKKKLTVDGLLPNAEGYALMAPVFTFSA